MKKFKANKYVKIKSCKTPTHWYNNKIGKVYAVSDNIFPPDFLVIGRESKRGKYPMINEDEAEVVPRTMRNRLRALFQ